MKMIQSAFTLLDEEFQKLDRYIYMFFFTFFYKSDGKHATWNLKLNENNFMVHCSDVPSDVAEILGVQHQNPTTVNNCKDCVMLLYIDSASWR